MRPCSVLRPLYAAALAVLVILLVSVSPACAGKPIPVELVLHKSTLLKFNKKLVLVTLANTRKEMTQKDADLEVAVASKKDSREIAEQIAVAEQMRKKRQQSEAGNTNMYVIAEVLSPYDMKLDGIATGSTSMIVWTQGEGEEKPTPEFYDIRVVGNRTAIENQLREIAPDDEITVQFANETIILSGKVKNDQIRTKAEKIAQAFAPQVQNYLAIDDPAQVLLQVKVAQVDKSSLKTLGLSFMLKGASAEGFSNLVGAPTGGATVSSVSEGNGFTSSTQGSGTGISGNTVGVGSYNPLDNFQLGVSHFKAGVGAVLKALATKGYAKILSEPNLLVKSGQEGNFLAGSRIPYSVVASAGGLAATEIKYESVGIKIKFKPEVLENGLISLKIDPAEVSSIAGTMAVNGYPIIDTREVRTNVELKEGESLVLAGLLQEEAIKTMSKIPLLGDIPIIGALFRSTQDDLREKELVFFIEPKIIKPQAPGTKTELPTDRKLTPEEERELQWMPLGE